MFDLVRSMFRRSSVPNRRRAAPLMPKRRLLCEALEERLALSLAIPETHINTKTSNNQAHGVVASNPSGQMVVVWQDQFSATDTDIRAQRFSSTGAKIGGEIIVAFTGKNETNPAVAMDANGNFVVSWTLDFSATDRDVQARRFNANGVAQGGVITVAGGGLNEYDSSVAMAANGSFVVSYTLDVTAANSDVMARRFSNTGGLLSTIAVANTSFREVSSDIAASPDGRFGVAFQRNFASGDTDVILSRFNAAGGSLGVLTMDLSARKDARPSVAMDNFGNTVVAYEALIGNDTDIKAKRVSSAGALSSEINVRNTLANEFRADVALDRTSGRFVVGYNSQPQGGDRRAMVTEISAFNSVISTTDLGATTGAASVAFRQAGRYFVAYQKNSPIDAGLGIFGRFGTV